MCRKPPWWNRRSRLERMLCATSLVMVLLLAGTSVSLAVVGYRLQHPTLQPAEVITTPDRLVNPEDIKYCLTPGCVKTGTSIRTTLWVPVSVIGRTSTRLCGFQYLAITVDVCTAASLLNNLDESVSPCDNFYQFACGGWVERQMIPEDKSAVSVFSELQDDLNNKLRAMVDKPITGEEPDFIQMIKNMYNSCMNLSALETKASKPLQEVLEGLGGWPVVEGDAWNGTDFDWMEAMFAFRRLGYSHDILLDISVTPDARNNSRHVIDVDQTSLGMPDRSYLLRGLNDTSVRAYHRLMVESAVLLGAERGRAETEMLETLELEMSLANLSLPREERRNISKLYNRLTLQQLSELAPQIDWVRYFTGLLVQPVAEDEAVIVNVPEFVKSFAHLITHTDKKLVANYMMWRLVGQSLSMLHKPWRDLAQQYSAVITGRLREEPRWEQCMASLTGSLGVSLASLYVRSHFQEESKESVGDTLFLQLLVLVNSLRSSHGLAIFAHLDNTEFFQCFELPPKLKLTSWKSPCIANSTAALNMVNYIHREFLKILDEITWMDDVTKQKARAKALAIKPYIGYPDELLNNTKVSGMYANLTITPDDYFTNIQNIRKWSTDYAFNQLRKPNEKGEVPSQIWKKHARAAVVNAYYNALENSIGTWCCMVCGDSRVHGWGMAEFPAGILQGSFFSKDRPNYMNFGAIGFVIGHEITHGFDDRGRQFDKDGNNVNWWDTNTDTRFRDMADCIIRQYNNYSVPESGLHVWIRTVNGINTQGENIADNGGLKEAFRAYRSWVKDHGEELRLPGLKYTQNQLFWISAANVWCGKHRPEVLKLRILSGAHSPSEFRVVGPVSNLEDFSREFECPLGSPMNPVNKCTVW
ncbi:Nep2 [Cordylochernes scorpioides]|uniref:Nep2 n=1 Tax=Cordylochernes scorpioides TaxID=51811 RepID=A0ABY6LQV7_9ARAC|nr:Nep2 [Cordylochernes scorpioides]